MSSIDDDARALQNRKAKRSNDVGKLIRKLDSIAQEEKRIAESLMNHITQSTLSDEIVNKHVEELISRVRHISSVLSNEQQNDIERALVRIESTN